MMLQRRPIVLGSLAALPALALTTGRLVRIGILSSSAMPPAGNPWTQEMRERGWIEGQNVVLERRYADGKSDLLPRYAQELVQAKVDVIATFSSSDTAFAQRATSVIPIVMIFSGLDPVEEGFIASFARPGGNITGVSRMLAETRDKRLELIKAMVPSASRVAVLAPKTGGAATTAKFEAALRAAARVVQVELQFFYFNDLDELEAAFPAMVRARMHAFLLEPSFQTFRKRDRIAELALNHRLAGVFTLREYTVAGGLMSYGPAFSTLLRQHARYVDRILRGANPGDLPMEQPTRFDFVVNVKMARAMGITVPQIVLLQATELIE